MTVSSLIFLSARMRKCRSLQIRIREGRFSTIAKRLHIILEKKEERKKNVTVVVVPNTWETAKFAT